MVSAERCLTAASAVALLCCVLSSPEQHARQLRMSIPGIPTIQTQTTGNHGNAGIGPKNQHCVLDAKLTPETLPFFIPDVRQAWGSLCGRNRGVFVTDPPDGHTYSCNDLPERWGPAANVNEVLNQTLVPANVAVKTIENIVKSVYFTNPTKDAASCDFEGISTLLCGREDPWKRAPWYDTLKAPIRAVNIGGLFVLERWILPGFVDWGEPTGIIDQHSFSVKCGDLGICEDIKAHWKNFYTAQDFHDMKSMGLNSIRLPVGWWYFAKYANINSAPYIIPDEDLYSLDHPITRVLKWAHDAGLQVILDLHGAPGGQNGLDNSGLTSPDPNNLVWGEAWLYSPNHMGNTVKTLAAISQYINHIDDNHNLDNIMALELLNEPWAFLDIARVRDFYVSAIEAVRLVRPHLPVFIHDSFRGNAWPTLLKDFPYPDVFMDSHLYHGFNPSDAASDTPSMDRQKMYTHERMSCGYGSMLRYQTCSTVPVAVLEWSLAIDNCMPYLDPKKQDYGQCNHVAERLTDSWWTSHIRSFASRQIAVFEKEMGWSFWCWKLDEQAMKSDPSAAFWSFKLAVHKGYIDTRYPSDACMHPPAEDWAVPQVALPEPEEQPEEEVPTVEDDKAEPIDMPDDHIEATSSGSETQEELEQPEGNGDDNDDSEEQLVGLPPSEDASEDRAPRAATAGSSALFVAVAALILAAAALVYRKQRGGGSGGLAR
eukprot:Partr_v1_DN22528_c0_g1_i2_m28228 putative Glucan 1,3-beta-glucosidase